MEKMVILSPVRLNKNKGIITTHWRPVCSGQGGERRKFSPLVFQWQGHLILKIKNKGVIEKMLYIAPDKLQSTLGLKLPPVFTFLPCLSSRQGLLPGGQGGRHALQGHRGPKYSYIWNSWEELHYNLLNLVTGPKSWDYIGNKVQENSGGQLGEKVGEKLGEKVGERQERKWERVWERFTN